MMCPEKTKPNGFEGFERFDSKQSEAALATMA